MRLTLRTLLAYRDGVLNQADRNVLDAKLRESATARGISLRIDESLKNPKLAPIPIDARDPWFDANQIAEYLDDTTSTDLVAEIERRCLENNALLSEVASCHSILSKALNETVEIPDRLKDRIKSLLVDPQLGQTELRIERTNELGNNSSAPPNHPGGLTAQEIPAIGDAATGPSPLVSDSSLTSLNSTNRLLNPDAPNAKQEERVALPAETHIKREKLIVATLVNARPEPRGRGIELSDGLGSQVPEYLRGTDRGRLKPILVTAGLLIGIIVSGLLALGSLENVGRLLGPSLVAKNDSIKGTVLNTGADAKSNGSASAVLTAPKKSVEAVVPDEKAAKSTVDPVPAIEPVPAVASPKVENSIPNAPSETVAADNSKADSPKADSATANQSSEGTTTAGTSNSEDGLGITWTPPGAKGPESKGPEQLALISRDVNSKTGETLERSWFIAKSGVEEHGKSWVFPFAYRSEIVTTQGTRVLVCGDSEIGTYIDPAKVAKQGILEISYGRVLLFPQGDSLVTRLKLPVGVVELRFKDSSSSCALETGVKVKSWDWMPKSSTTPSLTPEHLQLEPYVNLLGVQGELTCQVIKIGLDSDSASNEPHSISVGEVLRVRAESEDVESILNMPTWLKSNTERPIDGIAAKDLVKALRNAADNGAGNATENSAGLNPSEIVIATIEKLAIDRKPEVASMANRLLFQVGNFKYMFGEDGLLEKKGNFSHTSNWLDKIPDYVYTPERLKTLESDLLANHDSLPSDLLRLLLPMTEGQLEAGGDAYLVEKLSSEKLGERVLAIQQLAQITGSTRNFHPERSSGESLAEWKKLLEERKIRYAINAE